MDDATIKAAQSVWMFDPAYREYLQAKKDLQTAQARFDEAKALWEAREGGNGKPCG